MVKQNRDVKDEFDQIVDNFYQPIYKYCYNMLRNKSEAEDAVQEIFIKVYKAIGEQVCVHSMASWIYRIAYNHCLNMKRRQNLYKVLMFEFISSTKPESIPEEELLEKEFSYEIEQALTFLSFDQRTIFLLRSIDDMSYEQISTIMNKNETSIRKQYERARKKLRKYIENQKGVDGCEQISIN